MPISRENLFATVIGLMDGILTALTLAAAKIIDSTTPLTLGLTSRIAAGAAVSAACIFFVADYARLRRELVHAEQHLSLRSHGQLVVSQLGRAAIFQAARAASLSCGCSFLGASLCLLPAALRPDHPSIALLVSLFVLAILGVAVARVVHGNGVAWAAALVLVGAVLAVVGAKLHIV